MRRWSFGKSLALVVCCQMPLHGLAADDCGVPRSARPLEGLIDESKVTQGDASVIHDISSKRVALIVSPNAERQLAWNESLRQPLTGLDRFSTTLRGDTEQWEQANRDTYDARIIVDRIVKPFVAAAKLTRLMPDLAQFQDSGFELAVILDINFKCRNDRDFWGSTDASSEIEIAAYSLSPTFVMGPIVFGRGKFRATYATGMAEVARYRQDAINVRLDASRDFQSGVARAYPSTKATSSATQGSPDKP
jgi:hypothetical protein